MLARIKNAAQIMRDSAAWRASNFRLVTAPLVDRESNRRTGFTDRDHLLAAAEWLERAQDAGGDGGVVGRYKLRTGWTSSYPETTGYIVPTFLRLADTLGHARYRERAGRCIDFLISVQLECGAFPGLEIADNRTEPSIFNTAQIICGLRAWYAESKDGRVLEAARRACDWLVAQQDADGVWRRFLYQNILYTYMAHASCWIAELGATLDHKGYLEAARRHLEWVLKQQDPVTGWFDLCGFSEEEHRSRRAPLHTIAYTIWGVLMTSRILGHENGMRAARTAARQLARRLELSRWLPGILDHQWRGCATHACLTGNVQVALIWLELHRLASDPTLVSAACKAIDLVKRAQPMASSNPGIRGGIPGSDPVWGDYMYMAIPNWAAKFFVDALIEKQTALDRLELPPAAVPGLPVGIPSSLPKKSPLDARGSQLRIVLYASTMSDKVRRMVTTWSQWGFRPTAVVVEREPTPSMATRSLEKLRDEGLNALATSVWSRVRRRKSGPVEPSVTTASGESTVEYCRSRGIPVIEVGPLDSEQAVDAVRALAPDLAIHAGAGILRKAILDVPRLGTLNAHMGILPPYRGMNVAEWSRLQGYVVGCTVHLIDEGIDTGDIICCRAVSLDGVRSVGQLRSAVNQAQIELLGEVVRYVITSNSLPPRHPQASGEGHQYFAMHRNLVERLEKALRSSVA